MCLSGSRMVCASFQVAQTRNTSHAQIHISGLTPSNELVFRPENLKQPDCSLSKNGCRFRMSLQLHQLRRDIPTHLCPWDSRERASLPWPGKLSAWHSASMQPPRARASCAIFAPPPKPIPLPSIHFPHSRPSPHRRKTVLPSPTTQP